MGLKFIRMAVVYAFVGIGIGIYMAASHSFVQHSTHAHANLIGWVSLAVSGLIYQAFPGLGRHLLAKVHFWLHNSGLLITIIGLWLLFSGNGSAGEPLASIGSVLVALGFVALGVNVFRPNPLAEVSQ